MSVEEMWIAVQSGDIATVKDLLSGDPELINERDGERWRPLHWAALRGHFDVAEAILKRGGDPNIE